MFLARQFVRIAAIASLLLAGPSHADDIAQSGVVYMHSDTGSWVGGGIGAPEVTWQHGIDGVFIGGAMYNGQFSRGVSIRFDDGDYWRFDFVAPTYNPNTRSRAFCYRGRTIRSRLDGLGGGA